jgi:hypothetical protein
MPTNTNKARLSQRWFLSFCTDPEGDKVPGWQGRVLGEICEGYYLVQLHEWLMGGESDMVIVPITRMVEEEWVFFKDSEDFMGEWDRKYKYMTKIHRNE